ncbi:glucosaminidase domain-containing protein [Sediminibacterium goheungense]|uniref:Peptidoglycan hydrolase n=1 Tax=Sediminibacterium goheungense TaxID=1086393 RepID=A0A4R6ISI0_9BACT|nr:glucosaminidase domain-containing protein [Sediminibacterium goheungense]TDO25439.1 flagellum-specific peptidoglycan hydrolase FlgJ [Sediminibacterium goheungense]
MKKWILLILVYVSVQTAGFAQNLSVKEKTEAYINSYKEIAIEEMLRTGVPASIKLAQGILESQFGESPLAKNANNHFGIKCKTEWTGEKTYQDDDAKGECFRVYPSAEQSYRDHSDFLKTRPHYSFLFKLEPTDITGWAYGLKRAGYATSSTYPEKLLRVIEDYKLHQYTMLALAIKENRNAPVPVTTSPPITTTTAVKAEVLNKEEEAGNKQNKTQEIVKVREEEVKTAPIQAVKEEMADKSEDTVVPEKKAEPTPEKKPSPYPEGVFTINHTKAIYAREGTSLLALAHRYDISLSKLFDFNELPESDILDADHLLFIEKKQKRGASDLHEVTAGETLHEISQKEGIRLESLLEYNKLKKDSQLSAGQKLYLRSPAEIKNGVVKAKTKNTK